MAFLELQNAKIYYETLGKGEPVFFVNGLFGSVNLWKKDILLELQKDYQCVTHNYRGQDLTEITGIFSVEDIVFDLHQLVESMGFNQISLVGDAFGSNIALAYALKFPQKVSKIVVCSTSSMVDMSIYFRVKFWQKLLVLTDLDILTDGMISDLFTHEFLKTNFKQLDELKKDLMGKKQKNNILKLFDAVLHEKGKINYAEIKPSVLILQGTKDKIISRDHGFNLKQFIPHSQYHEFDCGHGVLFEKKNDYLSVLKHFLQ